MAQDLSAAGAELPEIMTVGRWEIPTMPARYTHAARRGSLRTGPPLLTAGRNRGAQTKTFSGEMMTDKLSLY